MVPAMMEELLFDDILFGQEARSEHGRMRRVLQLLGIETLEIQDLLAEVLQDESDRHSAFEVLLGELSPEAWQRLSDLSPEILAERLIAGVQEPDKAGIDPERLYELAPLPNYCFQRDPMIVLNDGLVFCSMATGARRREALLSRFIARRYAEFSEAPTLWDPHQDSRPATAFLEGGDLLVLSPDIVAVGASERTNREGIDSLAKALCRRESGPRWLFVVEIPKRRAYMHLDTLITPVDRDACLHFAPVIARNGRERRPVYEIDLHADTIEYREVDDLLSGLRPRGLDFTPIRCGGSDPIRQRREQWTDGANAMALAPGVILKYDRNIATLEELSQHGFRILQTEDLLLGSEELDLNGSERACLVMQSNELSRARGGPHCLLHPLVRDSL
jgi:arginine deiminase